MGRHVKIQRKFNGEWYDRYSTAGNKGEAESDARDARKSGCSARVVYYRGGMYFVYARCRTAGRRT